MSRYTDDVIRVAYEVYRANPHLKYEPFDNFRNAVYQEVRRQDVRTVHNKTPMLFGIGHIVHYFRETVDNLANR